MNGDGTTDDEWRGAPLIGAFIPLWGRSSGLTFPLFGPLGPHRCNWSALLTKRMSFLMGLPKGA